MRNKRLGMKRKINYYMIGVEVIMLIIGVILIKKGYFNWDMFIRAVIIMGLMVGYKWIGHKVGIPKGFIRIEDWGVLGWGKEDVEFIKEEEKINKDKMYWLFTNLINDNKYLIKKYPIVIDIGYWMFRIIPWNWVREIILNIGAKMHDIVLIINSNKDIYYKKKYGRDVTQESWGISGWKYWWVIQWTIIYPGLRLLLIPHRMRKKIFEYYSWDELIRVRILVYLYSLIYLYIGYYEFVWGMSWLYKIIIVYIIVAIIWPWYIDWNLRKRLEYKEIKYYKPSIEMFIEVDNSISLKLFGYYVEAVAYNYGGYLELKYGCNNTNGWALNIIKKKKVGSYIEDYENLYGGWEGRWKYEKLYGFSYLIESLILGETTMGLYDWLDEEYTIYLKGVEELGEERMKEYEGSLEQLKRRWKCWVYIYMDVRRLMGIEEKEWRFSVWKYEKYLKDEIYFEDEEAKDDGFTGREVLKYNGVLKIQNSREYLKKNMYKRVPEKYKFSLRTYNKLMKLAFFVDIGYFGVRALEYSYARSEEEEATMLISRIGKERIKRKKEEGIELKYKKEECGERVSEVFNVFEEIDKINSERAKESLARNVNNMHHNEFWEEINEEAIREYMEEYEKKKGIKEILLSEEYIRGYVKKYINEKEYNWYLFK